jgi:hypothetical protein
MPFSMSSKFLGKRTGDILGYAWVRTRYYPGVCHIQSYSPFMIYFTLSKACAFTVKKKKNKRKGVVGWEVFSIHRCGYQHC